MLDFNSHLALNHATLMPSLLKNAHNFAVRDVRVVNAANYHVHHGPTVDPRERLLSNVTIGALYNSAERCDAPKCHPQTRVAVQEEILGWITHGANDAQPKKVLWMSGPAGSGKTAIAGSVAELCKAKDQLAASFFFSSFSGSRERCSKRRLVTTIAYQLQQHDSLQELGRRILASIDKNPAVFQLRLMDQLEELVLVPLRDARRQGVDTSSWTKAIILDGLDEVEPDEGGGLGPSGSQRPKEEVHLEILSVLLHAANDPAFPFHILVVSRPEKAIRRFFSAGDAKDVTREMFLDEKYDPDADITLFLKSKFAVIREEYGLPATWPTEDAIVFLVRNASGQFIYADTVVRYVSDKTKLPQAQLDRVLKLRPPADRESNPFATLDALYTRILQSSPDPRLAVKWIWYISNYGCIHLPALFWTQFLELEQGEGVYLLSDLSSLISVRDPGDPLSPYIVYHKSLSDFLSRLPVKSPVYVPRHGTGGRDEFYATRFIRVVQNRGPAVPLSMNATERSMFLRHFTNTCFLVTAVPILLLRSSESREQDLCSLDIQWLIRMVLSFFMHGRTVRYEGLPGVEWSVWAEALAQCFREVHRECSWYGCLPICYLWRTSILQVCQEYGWGIPGKWMLRFKRKFLAGRDSETGEEIWLSSPSGGDFIPPPPNVKDFTVTGSMASTQDFHQHHSKSGAQEHYGCRMGLGLFPLS